MRPAIAASTVSADDTAKSSMMLADAGEPTFCSIDGALEGDIAEGVDAEFDGGD